MFKLKGVGRGDSGSVNSGDRKDPGAIRLQSELSDLDLPNQCKIDFPDKNDLMNFRITIRPDEGFWRNSNFIFAFLVKPLYPHDAPKVTCLTKVFHPNIDLEGHVCLNILREDWNPILSISAVVYGLLHLFLEPNPNDPLNKEAAELLRNNKQEFARNVERSLRGGCVMGVQY